MKAEAKVTLHGALSIAERHCDCCQSKNMMNLLDDEGSPQYYCGDCFSTNCNCGGSKVVTIEK